MRKIITLALFLLSIPHKGYGQVVGGSNLPVGPNCVTIADGQVCVDSIQHWPHVWAMYAQVGGSVDKLFMLHSTTELDANSFTSGSTTCGIQEAINALPNAADVGGIVHFHGKCTSSTQLTIKSAGGNPDTVTLLGDGPNSSTYNYTGTGTTGIIKVGGTTFDTRNVTIQDMNISCNGALGCIGINAIRTKNMRIRHVLFDNSGAAAGGNTSSCVVSDGSSTAATFTAFNDFEDNRCLDGFQNGFVMTGSGSNEASNNNGVYKNNEFTQVNNGNGIAYDFQSGGGNEVLGGDIQNYATAYHVRGRNNILRGFVEGNTACINFDNAVYSAAQFNFAQVPNSTCTGNTDTGNSNVIVTARKHQHVTTGSIGGTTRTEVVMTWTTPWADANYSVNCNVEDSTTAAGSQGLVGERVRTKSATQVGYVINNPTGGALTGTLDCVADHD